MSVTLDAGPCRLVPWADQHLEELVAQADDERVAANVTDRFPHPYTVADGREWIAACRRQDPPVDFAIVEGDRVIGGAGISPFAAERTGSAEIGYWLGVGSWGRGLATASLVALTTYGFETLGLRRLQAGVFSWNPASVRVLEKAGYRFEGRLRRQVCKQGRIGDVLMYARLPSDPMPAT